MVFYRMHDTDADRVKSDHLGGTLKRSDPKDLNEDLKQEVGVSNECDP